METSGLEPETLCIFLLQAQMQMQSTRATNCAISPVLSQDPNLKSIR